MESGKCNEVMPLHDAFCDWYWLFIWFQNINHAFDPNLHISVTTGKIHSKMDKESQNQEYNDDVIKWKHCPRHWPFVRGIHRPPMNCPHKGQWRRALMLYLICDWINGWVNNRKAGDLRRHPAHYDVTVMIQQIRNCYYRKASNIRRTLVGNKIVDHSDVVGASPAGAAPTTSSFST